MSHLNNNHHLIVPLVSEEFGQGTMCYETNCGPLQGMLKSYFPAPEIVTLFGNKVSANVIKIK